MGLDMYLLKKRGEESEEIGYWRKANAIHKWMVENVQDGEAQNCVETPITHDQLLDLRLICSRVLEARNEAVSMELLPPVEGFFFGSTEIDECYYSDLEDTIKNIDAALSDNGAEFAYMAWW